MGKKYELLLICVLVNNGYLILNNKKPDDDNYIFGNLSVCPFAFSAETTSTETLKYLQEGAIVHQI